MPEWLPVAARHLSGDLLLLNTKPEKDSMDEEEEAGEGGEFLELPCFGSANSLKLDLGFLGLAVPPSGVFARLTDLSLCHVRFHGPCEFGDAVSSPRFPSLKKLTIQRAQGLSNFIIHSESLLYMVLKSLKRLQQLIVVAPALEALCVFRCFAGPSAESQPVAKISAPKLEVLRWRDAFDPSSVQFDKMANLQWLGPLGTLYFYVYGQEDYNRDCLRLLQRFQFDSIPGLRLKLAYLPAEAECESDCICDLPPNWTSEQLVLNSLHEVKITHLRGTEHEMAFVERLFSWAAVLKEMTVNFCGSITESTAKELCEILLSFSSPEIRLKFRVGHGSHTVFFQKTNVRYQA